MTTDGTVRVEKGKVVDTVTTGADGTAKSKELYLGRYEVKEVTAPYGMVLNEEVHSGELVYAGQEIEVTETDTGFYDERQRVGIDLTKSLAVDEAYGVGTNMDKSLSSNVSSNVSSRLRAELFSVFLSGNMY